TKANNYIASVVTDGKKYGIAFADITTGEFKAFETENLNEELERISPVECLIEPGSGVKIGSDIYTYEFSSFKDPRTFLLDHFSVMELSSFGIENLDVVINAAGRLLHYLTETQKTDLIHIKKIQLHSTRNFMPLDDASLRNLEIFTTMRDNKREGSLISILDNTLTAMGGRALKKWLMRPLIDAEKIKRRLSAVCELTKNHSLLLNLRESFKNIHDIERTLGRLSLNSGNARDLVALKQSFLKIPEIKKLLKSSKSALLKDVFKNLDELPGITSLIEKAICDEPPLTLRDGSMIKDSFDAELDKLKNVSRKGKDFIKELQIREIQRTGINSLKVRYNKVFGYYIEISNSNLESAPDDYIRKQTLVNAERFITPELKEYEETVLNAEEKICELEYRIFN
ncbi:MAG: DNA mismatch repair protein MutS, partial [Patescibacteria group bacterium]